jgi:hypothetical protein
MGVLGSLPCFGPCKWGAEALLMLLNEYSLIDVYADSCSKVGWFIRQMHWEHMPHLKTAIGGQCLLKCFQERWTVLLLVCCKGH